MSKRLWPIFLGPPLILAGAVLAISHVQPPVDAGKPAALPTIGVCSADTLRGSGPLTGAWWKTVDQLDGSGTLTGRKLFVGRGSTPTAAQDLPVESFVSGPVGGRLVVVADDGATSQVRLVSAVAGCGTVIHGTSSVVRTAVIDPSDGSVLAHLVDRGTRADLGTWRIAPGGSNTSAASTASADSEARLIAPPLGDLAAVVGTVWATDLRLDGGAGHLAVQSCADLGCLTRIFDLRNLAAPPVVIRGTDEGPMLGFPGPNLVTWAACPGYPCAILSWDLATGKSHPLVPLAEAAGLTRDGRRLVAIVASGNATRAMALDPLSGRSTGLRGVAPGQRPLSTGAAASIGLEVAADEIVLGSGTTDPLPFNPDTAAEEVLP